MAKPSAKAAAPRADRAAALAAAEASVQARAVAREPVRAAANGATAVNAPAGRAVALGRDGKPIWRHAAGISGDKFHIPPDIIPPGWSYEWKRHSVWNKEDPAYMNGLGSVGWTPVMAESHPGVFLPLEAKGHIIREGMILMERPMSLTLEAQAEEYRTAIDKVNRAKAPMLGTQGTHGVDTSVKGAQQATFVRSGVDNMADIPRPNLPYTEAD
jgi:hypothetical protein